MPRLFGFGDSFTQGHNLDLTLPNYKIWREYREDKKLPSTWFELLSEKLDYEQKNYAVAGMSNDEIRDTINKNITEIKKDDIVIINWSYNHRFRWAAYEKNLDGEIIYETPPKRKVPIWVRLGVTVFDCNRFYIDPKTQLDIAHNRSHELYSDEIKNYENLIDHISKIVGFKVFYWSLDEDIVKIFNKNEKKYILFDLIPEGQNLFDLIKSKGGRTISDETDGLLIDDHLGETGHRIQFELFYDYIKNLGI